MQTESEKSKANKLTQRHTHAFRANIERSRVFLTITWLINIVELITHSECSHADLTPAAAKESTGSGLSQGGSDQCYFTNYPCYKHGYIHHAI